MHMKNNLGRQVVGYSNHEGQRTRTLWICRNRFKAFDALSKARKDWEFDEQPVEFALVSFRPSYMNGQFYEVIVSQDMHILIQASNPKELALFIYCLSRHKLLDFSDIPPKVRKSEIQKVCYGHMIKNESNLFDFCFVTYRSIDSKEDFTVDSDDLDDPTYVPFNRIITVYTSYGMKDIGIPMVSDECLSQIYEEIKMTTEDT